MKVCFKYSVFSLAIGERIIDMEGSAEGISVQVDGSHGSFHIWESEILATPRLGRLMLVHDGTREIPVTAHHQLAETSAVAKPLILIEDSSTEISRASASTIERLQTASENATSSDGKCPLRASLSRSGDFRERPTPPNPAFASDWC
jgi:hypothetical protein